MLFAFLEKNASGKLNAKTTKELKDVVPRISDRLNRLRSAGSIKSFRTSAKFFYMDFAATTKSERFCLPYKLESRLERNRSEMLRHANSQSRVASLIQEKFGGSPIDVIGSIRNDTMNNSVVDAIFSAGLADNTYRYGHIDPNSGALRWYVPAPSASPMKTGYETIVSSKKKSENSNPVSS